MLQNKQLLKESREKYLSSLKNNYNIKPGNETDVFIILDAYKKFSNKYKNDSLIFKGAFNMFLHYSYLRPSATRDVDFSATTDDLEQLSNSIINSLNNFEDETYVFTGARIKKKLEIVPFGGYQIAFKISVKNTLIRVHGFMDLSFEDLPESEFIVKYDDKKYYSPERTFIDKYIASITKGLGNTRTWDAEDLLYIYPKYIESSSKKQILIDEIWKAMIIKKVTKEEIEYFSKNHKLIANQLKHPNVDHIFVQVNRLLNI